MKIALALVAFALLWTGCAHQAALPDPTIPHRVAEEAEIKIWVRVPPDGKFQKQTVRLLPGWWIAGPPVVEPGP